MQKTIESLKGLRACCESLDWLRSLPPETTPQQAWDQCERADWLLWIVAKRAQESDRKKIALVACECARASMKHVPAGEERPLRAIETTERWARGDATIEDVREARRNAAAAADAAADAAYAAAAADAADARGEARSKALREMAVIVRRHFQAPPEV